jgi:hypothetical protein
MMIETANEKIKLKGAPESDARFDPEELAIGIKVEMEHTTDPEVAKRIAKHHLMEHSKYYTQILLPGERKAGVEPEIKKSSKVVELFARETGLIRQARIVNGRDEKDDDKGDKSMSDTSPMALLVKSSALLQPTPVPSGTGAPSASRKETRKKVGKVKGTNTGIRSKHTNPAEMGNLVKVRCPSCGKGINVAVGAAAAGKGGKYGVSPSRVNNRSKGMKALTDLMPGCAQLLK